MENQQETMERLSVLDFEKQENKKKQLTQKYYNSYNLPFQPEINYVSKLFGRESSPAILYENKDMKNHLYLIKEKHENQINSECTFRPKINDKSEKLLKEKNLFSSDGGDDDGNDYEKYYYQSYRSQGYAEGDDDEDETADKRKKKTGDDYHPSFGPLGRINFQQPEKMFYEINLKSQQKMAKIKNEIISKEIEELQNCTFQPSLQHSFVSGNRSTENNASNNDPIVIRGLNRHLELKQLAGKLKKEEKEREYNAFHVKNVDKFRRQEDGSTIVKVIVLF
jgi:hypothetical protein